MVVAQVRVASFIFCKNVSVMVVNNVVAQSSDWCEVEVSNDQME